MKYARRVDGVPGSKHCSKCKQIKEKDQFYTDMTKATCLSSKCKECISGSAVVWKSENPEKVQADRDRYRAEHKEWLRDRHAKQRYETKGRVIDRLGGECTWCGFRDERALQFDHINGDGAKERSSQGFDWWTWVKKLDAMHVDELKALIQILCANCNQIKKVENSEYGEGKKSRRESARNCTCVARDRGLCSVHSYDGARDA